VKKFIDVPWKISEAITVFFVSWVGLPLIIGIGLGVFSAIVGPSSLAGGMITSGDPTASFVVVVLDALVGLWLVRLFLKRYGSSWSDVGLRSVNIGKALLLAGGVLVGFLILVGLSFALISLLFPSFNANQPQVNEFTSPKTSGALRVSFLALVVIPPFIEEIVFRGFIFPALTKSWGVIGGAIITSLLFAVAHWQLNISLYTLILSLLLCMLYYKLRSLWPGIFIHMINNYLAFMALVHK
jgi:membrane protease YdiL (CAAX protease family)